MLLAIGLLGGAGSVARFALDRAITERTEDRAADVARPVFPLGTLAVNLSGALLLGLLVGTAPGDDTLRLVGTGLLGAYTTFSTWMLETARLAAGGRRRAAAANIAVSLALGLLVVWLGRELGRAL
ncbi:MAG TPA: fluoride efflux transporter CrcB [Solirubrobacteraceae bacterium]|nr:fluoride efflux transporter CrcB [Solirubrobacteraceae bacterium]